MDHFPHSRSESGHLILVRVFQSLIFQQHRLLFGAGGLFRYRFPAGTGSFVLKAYFQNPVHLSFRISRLSLTKFDNFPGSRILFEASLIRWMLRRITKIPPWIGETGESLLLVQVPNAATALQPGTVRSFAVPGLPFPARWNGSPVRVILSIPHTTCPNLP